MVQLICDKIQRFPQTAFGNPEVAILSKNCSENELFTGLDDMGVITYSLLFAGERREFNNGIRGNDRSWDE